MRVSTCCGAEIFDDYAFCPDCHEHCGSEEEEDINFSEQCGVEKHNYLNSNK